MALPTPPLNSSSLSPQQQLPEFFKGGKTMETNHHLIMWLGIKMLYFCYVLSIILVGLSVGRSSAVAASWEPESGRSRWLEGRNLLQAVRPKDRRSGEALLHE